MRRIGLIHDDRFVGPAAISAARSGCATGCGRFTELRRIGAGRDLGLQRCNILLRLCRARSRCSNTSGTPGLASAGMGDVLSGIIGALLSQGAAAQDALLASVHLHGLAADECVRDIGGLVGLTATEVTAAARRLLNASIYGRDADDS